MSLRGAAARRTVCEVLREINDILQDYPEVHRKVISRLREAADMQKRMARKLYEYNREFDKDWWEENPDQAADIERRLNETYIS